MILGSGVALGVYVPPLLLKQCWETKYRVEFEVIETLFLDSKLEKIIYNKKELQNQRERRIAQELNLTRLEEK